MYFDEWEGLKDFYLQKRVYVFYIWAASHLIPSKTEVLGELKRLKQGKK